MRPEDAAGFQQQVIRRFLDYYDGYVRFEDAGGRPHSVQASTVDELFKEIRKGSRLRGITVHILDAPHPSVGDDSALGGMIRIANVVCGAYEPTG